MLGSSTRSIQPEKEIEKVCRKDSAYRLQIPHVPPSFAQCLQYLQFLQALQGSLPLQVEK